METKEALVSRHGANFDAADYLATPEQVAAYLDAMFEEGDPAVAMAALYDVLRSQGFAEITRRAGVSRESLYRTLQRGSDLKFTTLDKVLRSMGVRLAVRPDQTAA
jgi:probable addiction module antidote protein